LAQLDAAAVDAALLGENAQQHAVAAADIEHTRAWRHHLGDEQKVDAGRIRAADGVGWHVEVHGSHPPFPTIPRLVAAALKKPLIVSNSSGSCKRKAS